MSNECVEKNSRNIMQKSVHLKRYGLKLSAIWIPQNRSAAKLTVFGNLCYFLVDTPKEFRNILLHFFSKQMFRINEF